MCPGGMIDDDAEDNDTQINVVRERNGYWLTLSSPR